jgi:hypothetical protein
MFLIDRLDDMKKRKFLTLPGLELRRLVLPARSQSLYQLRCRGSFLKTESVTENEMNSRSRTQDADYAFQNQFTVVVFPVDFT